jgi:hypothetical protein
MKRGEPLKRKTALNPGEPLRRSTPLRSTPLRSGNGREGKAPKPAAKRVRYTGPSPALRLQVLQRDNYTCCRCGLGIDGKPYSLQHRLPRGRGGANTLPNLVTLCGDATNPDYCHSHVEQFRRRATREGWLVPTGVDPAAWPVLRFGEHWSMPGESWVECEPHSMQIDMGTAA